MASTHRNFRPRSSLPLILLLLACLSPSVLAIQKSLAGVVDWHTKLIGIPRTDLAPVLHTLPSFKGVEEDVLYTFTERGVLAALNTTDGAVVWRTQFEHDHHPLAYVVEADQLAVLSGSPRSQMISIFNSASGHLLTSHKLDSVVETFGSTPGSAFTPSSLGADISFVSHADSKNPPGLLILSGSGLGHLSYLTLTPSSPSANSASTNLSALSLKLDWTYTPADSGSTSTYIRSCYTPKDEMSGRIHLLTLTSGFAGMSLSYTSVEVEGRQGDDKEISDQELDPRFKPAGSIAIPSSIHSQADVKSFEISDRVKGEVKLVWFDHKAGETKTVTFGPGSNRADVLTTSPSPSLETGSGKVFTFRTGNEKQASLLRISPDGTMQYRQQASGIEWSREEALSDIKVMKLVELPEGKVEDSKGMVAGDGEGFLERLVRHIGEVKDLPSYLASFVLRFTTSGTYSKSISSPPLARDSAHLVRDDFGFQKLMVAATARGKIFGLDSANGNILWRTDLAGPPGTIEILDMFLVRGVSESGSPVMTVIGLRGETSETIAFHVDAFTGQALDVSDKPIMNGTLGKVIAAGRPLSTFILPVEHCTTSKKAVAIVDQAKKLHLFPYCKAIEAAFQAMPAVHLTIFDERTSTLEGYQVSNRPVGIAYPLSELWTLPIGQSDSKVTIIDQDNGPVSSLGRILWDRSTLYSVLNSHLLVATIVDASAKTAQITLIDSISGDIVYNKMVHDIVCEEGVEAVLSNNWLVYKYSTRGSEKGVPLVHRIVSVEVYEGSEASAEDSETGVEPIWRSFILEARISALAITTSRFGVTYKDLAFVNDRGQLAYIPNKFLDPRRPDVPDKKHQEEMLIPYQVFLPFDTRRTVSHQNEVLGLRSISTSASLLESTSLVVSHGLDIFASRITPSGTFDILSDAFNKAQLVLTILGLAVGISVARPAVNKRMVRSRWY